MTTSHPQQFTRTRSTRWRLAACLLVSLLVLSACGSSSDGSDVADDAVEATDVADDAVEATAAADSTGTSTDQADAGGSEAVPAPDADADTDHDDHDHDDQEGTIAAAGLILRSSSMGH